MTCARGARRSKYIRVVQVVQTFVRADNVNRANLHVTCGASPHAGFAGALQAFRRQRRKPRIRLRAA
jgi:hypothetical protein